MNHNFYYYDYVPNFILINKCYSTYDINIKNWYNLLESESIVEDPIIYNQNKYFYICLSDLNTIFILEILYLIIL